jgi:predicted aldo/keto reductase-like oxidoreductase
MLYRPLGKTGEMVSVLGFGAMRLPVLDHRHDQIDEPLAAEMLQYAISEGVNYVDTAHNYHGTSVVAPGNSQPFLGKVLAGGLRDKVLLATKLPLWAVKTRSDMDRVLAEQLRALRTDHIDCYLLHGLDGRSWEAFRGLEVVDFLDAAKADGRIRYAGFSFHDVASAFAPIVDVYDWDLCQIQYNYMDVDLQAGTAGLRYAAERGLGMVIMEPVKGGRLAGRVPAEVQAIWDKAPEKRTPPEWALRFVWDDKDVSLLLSGMTTMEQLQENIRLADQAYAGSFSRVELDLIAEARAVYQDRVVVDCTGCRYCMPCPTGIDIPTIFAFMNDASLYGDIMGEKIGYNIQVEFGFTKRASECIECGQCESACPQAIEVPKMLGRAVKMFED